MFNKAFILCCIFFCTVLANADSSYYADRHYEVTVTNITKGQSFTPILSATHSPYLGFFEVGEIASEEIEVLAESGNTSLLQATLSASEKVHDIESTAGLLAPGSSVTYTIEGNAYSQLSLAAMLIPTNDTFVSLDAVSLPRWGTRTYYANAYDAGTETNDEVCSNIPGPVCGGAGPSPEDNGEGYVYVSPGIHGEAELASSAYDWRSAVAKVIVRRVK